MVGAAITHHVAAQCRVRDLRGDVDRVLAPSHDVEVVGEALPTPRDAFVERGAGDVLDALHQFDEPLVTVGTNRREAHAAVAHDDGRDAVPGRRSDQRIPGDLPVVVRVDVDPPRRDEEAGGVDLVGTPLGHLAHRHDSPFIDGDVGHARCVAGTVDHRAASDHHVSHAKHLGTHPRIAPVRCGS